MFTNCGIISKAVMCKWIRRRRERNRAEEIFEIFSKLGQKPNHRYRRLREYTSIN